MDKNDRGLNVQAVFLDSESLPVYDREGDETVYVMTSKGGPHKLPDHADLATEADLVSPENLSFSVPLFELSHKTMLSASKFLGSFLNKRQRAVMLTKDCGNGTYGIGAFLTVAKKNGKKHMLFRTGKKYDVEEILSKFDETMLHTKEETRFGAIPIRMGSHRYWTFAEHGVACVKCGIRGEFFVMEKHHRGSRVYHFNLYATDKDGEEVLMTKDHIIPKSKGGRNHISNYQPMCTICNRDKNDSLE